MARHICLYLFAKSFKNYISKLHLKRAGLHNKYTPNVSETSNMFRRLRPKFLVQLRPIDKLSLIHFATGSELSGNKVEV